jgi:hypothetical protein
MTTSMRYAASRELVDRLEGEIVDLSRVADLPRRHHVSGMEGAGDLDGQAEPPD